MAVKDEIEKVKKLKLLSECLIDYVGPLFIVGDISIFFNKNNSTFISATSSKEEFAIINNNVPNWIKEVISKGNNKTNILIIDDIDSVEIEKQELLLDIIKDNEVSTEKLPSNLKIILHANKKCNISPKIKELVECYEV